MFTYVKDWLEGCKDLYGQKIKKKMDVEIIICKLKAWVRSVCLLVFLV